MVQIATFFASAKNLEEGFFSRDFWLLANQKILEFLELLQTKVISIKKSSSIASKDEGGDIDAFTQSSDAQL